MYFQRINKLHKNMQIINELNDNVSQWTTMTLSEHIPPGSYHAITGVYIPHVQTHPKFHIVDDTPLIKSIPLIYNG